MADIERVIKGLEKCKRCECDDCTEKGASQAPWDCPAYECFVDNAIALLKEQEPVEPIPPIDESDLWKCGNCNHQLFRCTHQRYCEMCGRSVKWK